MNRREDWYCVIYHLFVAALYFLFFVAYSMYFETFGAAEKVCFVATSVVMLGWISGLNVGVVYHNHVHKPVFRNANLNCWFGRFWTISGGWPAALWNYAHLDVHHRHVLETNDWTLPRELDGKFESIYSYCFFHPFRYARAFLNAFRSDDERFWRREPIKECFIFLVIWLVPWLVDPQMALLLWLLPQWFGNAVVMGAGMYVQHLNCRPKTEQHPHRHSNEFHSWFFNMTMFNIGFHLVHHDWPGVHWYDLAEHHNKMQDRMVADDYRVVPFGYYRAAFRQELVAGAHQPVESHQFENKGTPFEKPFELN